MFGREHTFRTNRLDRRRRGCRLALDRARGALIARLALACCLITWSGAGYAQTNWNTTATNGFWGETANWSNGIPGSGVLANFTSSTVTTTFIASSELGPVPHTDRHALGLAFSGEGDFQVNTNDGTWILNAGGSRVYGSGTLFVYGSGISVGGGTQTIAPPPRVSTSAFPIANNGTLIINGGLMMNSGLNGTVTFSGSGDTTVARLSRRWASQNTNFHIVKNGTGTLTITGAESGAGDFINVGAPTGTTTINGGTISINAEANLGRDPGGYYTVDNDFVAGTFNAAALVLNGGALRATAGFAIDDGNRGVTLGANGGTFDVPNAGHTLTIANVITGPGALTKTGSGTLLLTAANTYAGDTRAAAGTLTLGNAAALAGSTLDLAAGDTGIIAFGAPAAFTLGGLKGTSNLDMGGKTLSVGANGQSTTYAGSLSNGSLVKTGAGTLTLSGESTYTGTTVVSEGVLSLSSPTSLATASVIELDGGTLRTTGSGSSFELFNSIKLTRDSVLDPQFVSNTHLRGVISDEGGAFGFTKTGTRNLYLRTANTYQGDTILQGGTTYLYAPSSLGTVDGSTTVRSAAQLSLEMGGSYLAETLYLDGGVLRTSSTSYTSARTWTGDIVLTAQSNIRAKSDANGGGLIILAGVVSGNASLLVGSSSETGSIRLASANTYSGDTRVVGGTLELHHALGLQNSTLDLLGADTGAIAFGAPTAYTLGGLKGTRNLEMGGKTLAVGANGQSTTYAGSLGNGSLAKTGDGTLTLTGASTYTGATNVNWGTLVVNGSIAASSGVTLAANTLLQGSGSVPAISGAGLVSPGNSPGILTATSVDPSGGLDFAFEFTAAAPDYSTPTGSLNDVFRLTNASAPFAGLLSAGNEIALYLNVADVNPGDVFLGGFYTDLDQDFSSALAGATVNAYVARDGNGPTLFEGTGYYALADLAFPLNAVLGSVAATADFGGGVIHGRIMQVTVLPEPSTWLLGLLAVACLLSRRRTR